MSDISRRHTLVEGSGGLLTITGGKLTTYRRMAKDVVDRIVERDGRKARCRTDEISLTGTRPYAALLAETTGTAAGLGLDAEVAASLVRQSGEAASDILSLVAADHDLGRALSPSAPHIAAEIVQAARRGRSHPRRRLQPSVPAVRCAEGRRPPGRARRRPAARGGDRPGRGVGGAQVRDYADVVRRERGVLGLERAGLAAAG